MQDAIASPRGAELSQGYVIDMKRKIEDETTQTAIRLPTDLYQRLKRAGGERGMAEQIRSRLEASFEVKKTYAPETQELLAAIARAADETAAYYGDCVKDAFSFEVLKLCIELLLKTYQPEGEVRPNPDHSAFPEAEMLFGPEHSPHDISRVLVRVTRARGKREDEGKRR
jgi:hypothetical protein